MVDALAFGIIVPVVPTLVMRLTGLDASDASIRMGGLLAAFSLMQFLCAPLLGALSDRYGRRVVLLLSLAGICANNLMLAAAPTLAWLFVGRLMAGATAANFAAATASIADVSTPEQRAQRFGLVGAMFGLGFVLGPALGGWLGGYGLRVPFLVAAGLAGANLLYGAAFVPETLAPENRRPFLWRSANPFGNLAAIAHDGNYARLVIAWCCTWFALGALQSSFVLANDLRLGWGSQQNGIALAAVGVGSALVQGLLVRRAVPRLGERGAALAGYALAGLAYLCFAFANQVWVLGVGIALQALGAISGPAIQSMVSAGAGPDQQGQRQGALASFQGLTAIGAPLLAGWVFGVFTRPAAAVHFPGAPFAMAAVAYGVAHRVRMGLETPGGMTARFFRRPYPSANTVLLTGPRPVLVDTGATSDVPALFGWLAAAGQPPAGLALVANTHWHVDHTGGNPALRRLGVPVGAEAHEAAALDAGTPDPCRATWLHQPCDPCRADRALHPGDVIDTGARRWTVLRLPGHTATQVGFWDPCGRILVAGDALHDADLGWLDIDADPAALDQAEATVGRIAALAPGIVLSGHGPVIDDVPAALGRARRRLAGFRARPERIAWHAAKRIFTHALMLEDGLPRHAIAPFLCASPWLHDLARRAFGTTAEAFIPVLLAEMTRSGAARWDDGRLLPSAPYAAPARA